MKRRLSLRLRLLIATGIASLVALGIADAVVYDQLRSYLYTQVDNTLESSHIAVEALASTPGGASHGRSAGNTGGAGGGGSTGLGGPGGPPGSSNFCAVGRESAPGMFIEVVTPHNAVVTSTNGKEKCPAFQPGSVTYYPELPAVITGYQYEPGEHRELVTYFTVKSTVSGGPAFRVRASKLTNGNVLIIADPIGTLTATLSQLLLVELLVTAGALVVATLLGFWLVRVGLQPLGEVEKTAQAIVAGDLEHRVPHGDDRTEVGHLASAFNSMLDRIAALVADLRHSEARLRRFVGDASHELRTPIAAVSAYAQLFDKGPGLQGEDLERVMKGIEYESSRMARLVEDLLTLAKLDESQQLETEPVELVGLVIEATQTSRLVGPEWPVDFEAEDAVEVLGNRSALRQVVDNLLANVRAHTPPGTSATVRVAKTGDRAEIEVADTGPGISEVEAAQVFERFFRADPSRSRETGGAGLGLAIVASIVAAHGGSVEAAPRTDRTGTVFRVVLPLLPAEPPALAP